MTAPRNIKTTADYKEALYEKQHMECVTLRTQLAEALDRVDRAQAAMLEEVNARIASEDKEHDARTQLAEAVALLREQNELASTLYDSLGSVVKALNTYADGPATPREMNISWIVRKALDEGEAKGRNADAFLARIDAKGGA